MAGYRYFIDPDHPLVYNSTKTVYLHRHLASIKLGRWLTHEEHVHHIDGNKLNNSLENLEVLSNKEHAHKHRGHILPLEVYCKNCCKLFIRENSKAIFCTLNCANTFNGNIRVKNKDITKDMLESLMPQHSWVSLAALLGYSPNGIKKRAETLGCDLSKIKTKSGSRNRI